MKTRNAPLHALGIVCLPMQAPEPELAWSGSRDDRHIIVRCELDQHDQPSCWCLHLEIETEDPYCCELSFWGSGETLESALADLATCMRSVATRLSVEAVGARS